MFFKKKEIADEESLNRAVEALQQGSAEAFHILYNNYAQKVYRFCLRMLSDAETAQDAFQETFIRVYENRESFHGSNFAAWLFTIARNTCLNHIRSRKEQEPFDEVFHGYDSNDGNSDPILKSQIEQAIADLPTPLREALLLREYEDFSYQEIADTLDIDLSLAKVRVHRARLILRKLLKPLVKELNES
jgi:RNA polymerase sigma-70 factor (ECF subfamily)